ncbi:MAG: HD domain-containing protein [Lachnospiraceae bacterium]|nr:HD domain-containing protein [Lachnospiraceae bacterium]
MRYINELRDGEMLNEVYLCKQCQTLKTKTGKNYMALTLQDQTGTLEAKIWDLGPGIGNVETMDYVKVEGQLTTFQNNLQLNVRRIRKADEGEYDPADYMPVSGRDRKEMYAELKKMTESVKEPHLKSLLQLVFDDKEISAKFMSHSAAKAIHHAFIGGLLEHTLGVTRLCSQIADDYPMLNRDLLVTAAIFHDIGKLFEISSFPENDYTDEGNLLGHIFLGAEYIGKKIGEVPHFPQKLAAELRHCILAHHGELEFGSPKKPAIAEALALSMADNLDAKMETLKELFAGNENAAGNWLGYQKLFESNIRATSK